MVKKFVIVLVLLVGMVNAGEYELEVTPCGSMSFSGGASHNEGCDSYDGSLWAYAECWTSDETEMGVSDVSATLLYTWTWKGSGTPTGGELTWDASVWGDCLSEARTNTNRAAAATAQCSFSDGEGQMEVAVDVESEVYSGPVGDADANLYLWGMETSGYFNTEDDYDGFYAYANVEGFDCYSMSSRGGRTISQGTEEFSIEFSVDATAAAVGNYVSGYWCYSNGYANISASVSVDFEPEH